VPEPWKKPSISGVLGFSLATKFCLPTVRPMQVLAVATTAADKLQAIPADFWVKLALAVVGFVIALIFIRKIIQVNKLVLAAVTLFAVTMIGFNWIFERNEPKWATPAVGWLSGFFPSKGSYAAKQQTAPPSTKPVAAKRS
jgi:hypothetical protein